MLSFMSFHHDAASSALVYFHLIGRERNPKDQLQLYASSMDANKVMGVY